MLGKSVNACEKGAAHLPLVIVMFIVWKNNMFQRKMWVEIAALKLISGADDVFNQTPVL